MSAEEFTAYAVIWIFGAFVGAVGMLFLLGGSGALR